MSAASSRFAFVTVIETASGHFSSDAPDGGKYVALFNAASKAGEGPASVSVRLADLGISGWAYVRDLWSGRTFKAQDSLSADLPCHAAALFHVK